MFDALNADGAASARIGSRPEILLPMFFRFLLCDDFKNTPAFCRAFCMCCLDLVRVIHLMLL